MTSSPGLTVASTASCSISVAPLPTVISVTGSTARASGCCRRQSSASAARSRGTPALAAYWLRSSRMWRAAACLTKSGAGKSGKPCPRFTASCFTASAVISVKIDVPMPAMRSEPGPFLVTAAAYQRPVSS